MTAEEIIRQRFKTLPKAEKRWINQRVEFIMKNQYGMPITQQDREIWISNRRGTPSFRDLELLESYTQAFQERLDRQNKVLEAVRQLAEA